MTTANASAPTPYATLQAGEPAPWFVQRSTSNPRYAFHSVAGRFVLLCFFASSTDEQGQRALAAIATNRDLFDDRRVSVFGVSTDAGDEAEARLTENLPGIRHFFDSDLTASRLYGAAARAQAPGPLRPRWVLLDPTLRIVAIVPFEDDPDHAGIMARARALPPADRYAGFEVFAPVLILPNVFEPELCRELIDLYEREGGTESGFMRDVGGKTVLLHDANHKKRKDADIKDPALIRRLQGCMVRRVAPEIHKVHAFKATRMERYIVSCYAAEDGGHFRPHRDNTTAGTAHRRFAVSINLNAEFEGGELSFPEYGLRRYKAPPGGAVVFSGALLHAVSPVTAGRRYAFLPFLYDEEAAKIREVNAAAVEGQRYQAAQPPGVQGR